MRKVQVSINFKPEEEGKINPCPVGFRIGKRRTAMEGQSILYETLSPLAATSTAPTPTEDCKSYVVFRNLISLSSAQCASPESSTADYFSLEVNELEESKENSVLTAPLPWTPTEASTSAPHRTLEGNWFSSKSHFKSPMLRLHRGFSFLLFCYIKLCNLSMRTLE